MSRRVLAGTRRQRAVTGFVVKVEERITPPGYKIPVKQRREVSRLYHSRDAAEVCLKMFRAHNPNGDYYIHEKTGRDDTEIN